MNRNINLIGKLMKRKERLEEQVRIKTKKRRAKNKRTRKAQQEARKRA